MSNHTAAERASHDIREYLLCNHGRPPAVLEQRVTRTIEAAIDEPGAEKQQQIDKLVDALREARKVLVFWTGDDTAQTIELIDAALASLEEEAGAERIAR